MESEAPQGPQDPTGSPSTRLDPWSGQKPVVAMVHLPPLPGSPGFSGSMDEVLASAMREATLIAENGFHGILVENFGDAPFFPERVPSETVAALAVATREIVASTTLPVGVNVLRNDADAALSVAAATGARFIRINVHTGSMFTDQGLLEGQAHRTLRKRSALGLSVAILADIMVKHATPPPGLTLESAARDSWLRGMADGLVVTGSETGGAVDTGVIGKARESLPSDARVWVGSGAAPESASDLYAVSDGVIVGSALQRGGKAGGGIDPARARAFMEALVRG